MGRYAMDYTLYRLDRSGRICGSTNFDRGSDEDALAVAPLLLPPGEPSELWQRGRLIGRIQPASSHEARNAA
jgi:hypothetical protein